MGYSKREPVPAKFKNQVRERVKKKYKGRIVCEQCGKKPYRVTLEFHHKNMKNKDHKAINLQLLCPNCHKGKHARERRKVYRDYFGESYYSRKVKKKPKKKKAKKQRVGETLVKTRKIGGKVRKVKVTKLSGGGQRVRLVRPKRKVKRRKSTWY